MLSVWNLFGIVGIMLVKGWRRGSSLIIDFWIIMESGVLFWFLWFFVLFVVVFNEWKLVLIVGCILLVIGYLLFLLFYISCCFCFVGMYLIGIFCIYYLGSVVFVFWRWKRRYWLIFYNFCCYLLEVIYLYYLMNNWLMMGLVLGIYFVVNIFC